MNKIKIRVLKIYLYLKKKFTYIIGWVGSYGLKKTYINNITQLKKSNQIKSNVYHLTKMNKMNLHLYDNWSKSYYKTTQVIMAAVGVLVFVVVKSISPSDLRQEGKCMLG